MDPDRVPKQRGEKFHDGQPLPQPLPLPPVAFRIADLMELLEDRGQLVRRNAAPGAPDLNAQLRAGAAATHENAPPVGVFDRVGDEER